MALPNIQRNEVLIKLGEKEFLTRASFGFISKIESYFDKPLVRIANSISTLEMQQKDVAVIIEAGVISAGGKVDREVIEQAVFDEGYMASISAIADLIAVSYVGPKIHNSNDNKKK